MKIAGLNDKRALSAPEKTVYEMYQGGKRWSQICKAMHLPYEEAKTLLAQCREKGHYPDEKKREEIMNRISEELKSETIKLYKSGVAQRDIANCLGIGYCSVARIISKYRAEQAKKEEPATAATATSSETISNTPIINPLPEIVKPEPVAVLDPEQNNGFDAYEIAREINDDEDKPPFVVTSENVDQYEEAWKRYYAEHPEKRPEPPYIYSETARNAVYSEIQRKLSHLDFVKSAIEFLEHRIAEMQADEYYTSADIERLNADLEKMGGFAE